MQWSCPEEVSSLACNMSMIDSLCMEIMGTSLTLSGIVRFQIKIESSLVWVMRVDMKQI